MAELSEFGVALSRIMDRRAIGFPGLAALERVWQKGKHDLNTTILSTLVAKTGQGSRPDASQSDFQARSSLSKTLSKRRLIRWPALSSGADLLSKLSSSHDRTWVNTFTSRCRGRIASEVRLEAVRWSPLFSAVAGRLFWSERTNDHAYHKPHEKQRRS